MADLTLTPRPAFAGHDLPVTHADCTVAEFAPEGIVSLMPFRGRTAALSAALGVTLPAPGATATAGDMTLLWAGREAWLATGPADLPARLAAHSPLAAITDQSDSWCGLALSGPDARAVLARLCPLDLHPSTFPDGATARTDIAHMAGQVTRMGETFTLMVPRSYAAHFLHEVEAAMESLAAQSRL